MTTTLAIAEFEDEAEALLSLAESEGSLDGWRFVALEPRARLLLMERGAAVDDTTPYFGNEDHARCMLTSQEWLDVLEPSVHIRDGGPVEYAYDDTFLFYLRLYISHLLHHSSIVSNAIETLQPERIAVTVVDGRPDPVRRLARADRLSGGIAVAVARRAGVPCTTVDLKIAAPPIVARQRSLSWWERALAAGLRRLDGGGGRRPAVLVTGVGYNVGALVARLAREVPGRWLVLGPDRPVRAVAKAALYALRAVRRHPIGRLVPVSAGSYPGSSGAAKARRSELGASLASTLARVWRAGERLESAGAGFIDLLGPKIELALAPSIEELSDFAAGTARLAAAHDVRVLVSAFARDHALVAAEIVGGAGGRTLMVSHGTLKVPVNEVERIEYLHMGRSLVLSPAFTDIAVQAPFELAVCDAYDCQARRVVSGPLIYARPGTSRRDALRREIAGVGSEGRVLLYPENTRTRGGMRFHVFETFDEFVVSASEIVESIRSMPDVRLVIRFHPGRDLSESEIACLLPRSDQLVVTMSERPFAEALAAADVVVNYSSTVIEEALNAGVPVVLYDRWRRYSHLTATSVGATGDVPNDAAFYVDDPGRLAAALGAALGVADMPPGPERDALFAPYVVSDAEPGQPAALIAEALAGTRPVKGD